MDHINWQAIVRRKPPDQEPVLVASEHYPGWFDIGAEVLGEWRTGMIAGDRMRHEPTHWARLTPLEKRRMS